MKKFDDNPLLVMKFGGAALKNICHVVTAADIVLERKKHYPRIVVVVSAMGKMTDELMALAHQISSDPPRREQDMLISVGERMSMALLAIALKEKGCEAVSLTGSQSGIITCERHTEATIQHVEPTRIIDALAEGKIVIVAGFQGMSTSREITTLGRGGSDLTAVALGVALEGKKVEFYKDVAGVYSEDPQKNARARLFSHLSYKEAIAFAEHNSFVLHVRAIILASKNRIPLHVLTFKRVEERGFPGTLIGPKKMCPLERKHYESQSEKGSKYLSLSS